jgi:tRNA nucleotidyltransferase (CCA-adding enzyme)
LIDEKDILSEVCALVNDHMKPHQLYDDRDKVTDGAIRRLSLRVDIKKLVRLSEADWRGKGLDRDRGQYEPGTWLLKKSKDLEVLDSKPSPFLTGKILMDFGLEEGPEIGKIIAESFELQIDGKLKNEKEAIAWAKDRVKNN